MKPFVVLDAALASRPSKWRVASLQRVCTLREDLNLTSDAAMLSLASSGMLTDRSDDKQPPTAEYRARYGLVRTGDLVVNPMWLPGAGLGVSLRDGAVSPEYRIYRLGPDLYPRFIHHMVRSRPYLDQYRLLTRAETTFDRRVSKEDFRELPIVIPPLSVQRTIAHYLDRETARLDALIAARRRMVQLLEERRVAAIARLVTPDANPTGWHRLRLRHVLLRMIDTEHKTAPFYDDGEFLVIRTNNVSRGRLVAGPGSKFTDADGFREWTQRGRPEPGDILFTREAPAGEACIVPDGMKGCVGQRTVLFKVDEARIRARYCLWALYGGIARSFIDELSQGSTVPHLNMSDISDIPLWVPDIRTQGRIAARLDAVTSTIDQIVAASEQQIDLLGEHRQAVVTAAVTGRREIPEAA